MNGLVARRIPTITLAQIVSTHHAEKRRVPGTYKWQRSLATHAGVITAAGAEAGLPGFLRIVAEIK